MDLTKLVSKSFASLASAFVLGSTSIHADVALRFEVLDKEGKIVENYMPGETYTLAVKAIHSSKDGTSPTQLVNWSINQVRGGEITESITPRNHYTNDFFSDPINIASNKLNVNSNERGIERSFKGTSDHEGILGLYTWKAPDTHGLVNFSFSNAQAYGADGRQNTRYQSFELPSRSLPISLPHLDVRKEGNLVKISATGQTNVTTFLERAHDIKGPWGEIAIYNKDGGFDYYENPSEHTHSASFYRLRSVSK